MPLPRRLSGSRSVRYWVIVSLGVCRISIFHYPGSVCVYQCSAASPDEAVEVEAFGGVLKESSHLMFLDITRPSDM